MNCPYLLIIRLLVESNSICNHFLLWVVVRIHRRNMNCLASSAVIIDKLYVSFGQSVKCVVSAHTNTLAGNILATFLSDDNISGNYRVPIRTMPLILIKNKVVHLIPAEFFHS
jgi:hypothetical protein